MLCHPLCRSDLIIPRETAGAIGGELNVVRWISIDEIISTHVEPFQIAISEFPVAKDSAVGMERGHIIYCRVFSKRDIELAAAIEPAQAVVASAIQVIKKLRGFRRLRT